MELKPYIVYVKLNDVNRITAVNSTAFIRDVTGWTEIDSGFGDRYHHAQGNYFDKPIMDERGIYRYKIEDNKVIERTQEEMDADRITLTSIPSQFDIIEAQVTYTAMMTGTLLEV